MACIFRSMGKWAECLIYVYNNAVYKVIWTNKTISKIADGNNRLYIISSNIQIIEKNKKSKNGNNRTNIFCNMPMAYNEK